MIPSLPAQAIQDPDRSCIIDVRPRDEFLQEHIPGSQNIPLDSMASALAQLQAANTVILTCRTGRRANQAFAQLEASGLTNLQVLEGGLMAWKKAGRETVSLKTGLSIMQQVQVIVGLMVLVGTFYQPLWPLAAIAGAGLLMAGLTNTCMMAVVLSKMPWNKLPAVPACRIDSRVEGR